jgi:hypothetical protein
MKWIGENTQDTLSLVSSQRNFEVCNRSSRSIDTPLPIGAILLCLRVVAISLHFVAGEIGIGCHGNTFLRMISKLTFIAVCSSSI